jgi:hypothetical protein
MDGAGPVITRLFREMGITMAQEMHRKVVTQRRLNEALERYTNGDQRLARWLHTRFMNIYRPVFNGHIIYREVPEDIQDAILGGVLENPVRLACCRQVTSQRVVDSLRAEYTNSCPFCRSSPVEVLNAENAGLEGLQVRIGTFMEDQTAIHLVRHPIT